MDSNTEFVTLHEQIKDLQRRVQILESASGIVHGPKFVPNVDYVKQLRAKTGAGLYACKNALVQCNGDEQKAIDFLRRQGWF